MDVVIITAVGLGIASILLGARAFSSSGLPITRSTNISGLRAKLIGITCITFGVLAIFVGVVARGGAGACRALSATAAPSPRSA